MEHRADRGRRGGVLHPRRSGKPWRKLRSGRASVRSGCGNKPIKLHWSLEQKSRGTPERYAVTDRVCSIARRRTARSCRHRELPPDLATDLLSRTPGPGGRNAVPCVGGTRGTANTSPQPDVRLDSHDTRSGGRKESPTPVYRRQDIGRDLLG